MVKKIDDSTMVPITWIAGLLVMVMSSTWVVAWKVYQVDGRLNEIERRLGIEHQEASTNFIAPVNAYDKKER